MGHLPPSPEAPTFGFVSRRVEVSEGASPGASVLSGASLGASDPETPDASDLKFAILSGNQQGLWSMDAVGGDIRFAQSNPRALDFESAPRQSTLVVSVTDNGAPDGLKRSGTATLQMIVLDVNEPPAVVLPVAGLEVRENSAPGASAGSVSCADVDASDQSGLALALVAQEAIPGTSGVLPFMIDAGTGVLRVSPGAGGALLDAESKATYELQLQCTDNLGLVSETKSASVRIVDVNEAPVCAGPLSFSAAEGVKAMVGTPLGAVCSDPDSGDTLVFAIDPSSQAAAPAFAVDATSGQLRVHDVSGTGAGSVNDASARFALNVTVADKQGLATVVHVLVQMTDTNDPPVFGASVPRMLSVPESSTDGFIVALLQATDEDFASDQSHRLTYSLAPTGRSVNRPFPFAVTTTQGSSALGAGQIVLRLQGSGLASLDFEGAQSEFEAIVTATDNGTPQLSASAVVTIRVADAAEPPTFDALVAESSPDVDAATGLPVIRAFVPEGLRKGAIAFSVAATDPDAASQGHLEWAIAAPTSLFSEHFTLDPASGAVAAASDIDFEAIAPRAGVGLASGHALSVTVTVGDVNEAASMRTSAVLRVSVTDVNEPPVVSASTALEVAEDATSGAVVGTVPATDPDSGSRGQLRFRINGSAAGDGASFRIDQLSGAVSIASAGLDWEDRPEYRFQVLIQDGDSVEPLQVATMVTISVSNVNDVQVTALRLDPTETPCTSSPCAEGSLADMVPRPSLASMSSTGIFFSPLGGAAVQLVGTGIGFTAARLEREGLTMADVKVAVSYGPTATEYVAQDCRVVAAGSVVQCRTVAAWGGSHKWRLEVTQVGSTQLNHAFEAPLTTSAMPPEITSVTVSEHSGQLPAGQLPTYGGASFTVEGSGFGPKASVISLSLGGADGRRFSVQFCSVLSDGQNLAQCFVAPAGLGKNLLFAVVASGLPSAVFQSAVSYAPPVITSVAVKDQVTSSASQSTLRTRGGQVLIVSGSQLSDGAFPEELELRYGDGSGGSRRFQATQCRVTKPHTEMQCMSVAGVGFGLGVQVQVGGQWSEPSAATLAYASPIVSSVSGAGALASVTAGGETLSVVGDNFGPADTSLASVVVRYGPAANPGKYTAHSCRYGAANTEIVCLTAPGTGRAHALSVTVASQTSALLAGAVSYEPPVVAFYEGAGSLGAATDGMQEVLVTGRNFGPLGHGAIDVVVYRQPSGAAEGLTPTDLTTLASTSSQWSNWTDVPSLDTEQFVFRAASCRVSVAHVQMSCLTAEGAGRGMQWAAVVDGQASTVPSTSYGAPRLVSISGLGTDGATTDGGEEVVLRGANFGPSFELLDGGAAGFLSSVTYGPSRREYMAQGCRLASHSEIRCRTSAGVGRGHRWRVVVGGQETADYRDTVEARAAGLVLDYASPVLSSVSPLTGTTEGGFTLHLSGTNLGLSDARRASSGDAVMTVLFGDLQLPVVAQSSDGQGGHSADVYVPESDGGARDVQVRLIDPAGRETVSNTFAFVFGAPTLEKDLYVVLTIGNRFNITATGTNFGLAPRILVNGIPTENCAVIVPHRQVTCQFEGRSGSVAVVARSGFVSNSVFFDFISPSFLVGDASSRPLLDTQGGTVIRVEGLNWQTDPSQINVTVGGAPCPIMPLESPVIVLEDETESRFSLECRTPPGQGQDVPVVITRGGQASLPDFAWSYAPPSLASVDPAASLPTTGGRITIRGSNFGISGVVLLPGISVQVESWSHDTIVALVDAGEGAALSLEVDVAQQRSAPLPFSFAPPLITQAPATGPTVGQAGALIVGANFGVSMPTVSLVRSRLGVTGVLQSLRCPVVSFDHSQLVVNLPEGTGTGWRLVVTAAGQEPVAPPPFDFDRPELVRIDHDPLMGLPTSGGVEITALGANLGPSGAVLFLRAFGDSNPLSGYQATWLRQTHANATFTLPEGQGSTLEAVLTVDGQHSDPLPFAFDAPRIDSLLLPDQVPTEGTWRSRDPIRRDVVTIMGSSFGVQSTQRTEVRILPAAANASAPFAAISPDDFRKGVACTLSVEPDPLAPGQYKETESGVRNYGHGMIRAGIPEGYGRDLRLVVSVGGRLSNAVLFSYDPPMVAAAMPNVPTAATCPQTNAALGTCAAARPQGQSIRLTGRNFGETPPLDGELDIRIGGLPCSVQSWNRDATLGGRPYLTCSIPWDTVGVKNLTVEVALQEIEPWTAAEGLLATECAAGAYGVEGEHCLECPAGASCEGGSADPVSLPGWFDVRPGLGANGTDKNNDALCPAQRRVLSSRDFSPGSSSPCFVVVALAACVAGYVLNQKSVNVGLLAVGVDYFQVLAIFARTRVRWPAFVRDLFRWLSAFNLNLELAAPECVLPEMTFALKWFMTMLLPLAAVIVLGLTFGAQVVYKRFVMGRRDWRELTSHLDPLVAVMVVVGVFLYLVLSRMTLGRSETHLLLFPFAVTAAVLYVAGFPAFVFMFVRRNLYKVKYDQILRARGISPSSKLMPPQIKAFRARWHRLYYLYRPGKAYWLVVILARKFLVAFTALAFRSTPTYQLAASIVVLFAAFTLQVRHSPYMSLSDHDAVASQFRDFTDAANIKAEGTLQLAIRSNMDDFEQSFEAEGKRGAGGKWGAAASEIGKASSALKARATTAIAEQLVNYNAVEIGLLGCGILVTSRASLFLSERFADSYNGYYQAEYDTLAVVVGLVIFSSLVFFVGTLAVEVMHVAAPATAARVFGVCVSTKRADKRLARAVSKHGLMLGAGGATTTAPLRASGSGSGGGTFEMVNNPASSALDLAADGISGSSLPEELPDQETWSSVRANYRRNERQMKELRAMVSKLQDEAKRVETIASMATRLPSLADALADGPGASRRSPSSPVSSPAGAHKRRLRVGARSPHLSSRRSSDATGSDFAAPVMALGSPALPAFGAGVTAPPPARATGVPRRKR
ncbi:hypothetical protein FNF28_04393 [Cafeteria roenbergensis]|uniref:Cadherin domain-containing protein n=1 Tax=Cafeteria roenbergensis TaxID=33653 RepID=A0A5A8DCM3_CAFRO|nr:hypothetical protein FNF28_04393 [Cafeteria roenbergensis]